MRALSRTLAGATRCRAPAAQLRRVAPAAPARWISGTARLWAEAESPGCALRQALLAARPCERVC